MSGPVLIAHGGAGNSEVSEEESNTISVIAGQGFNILKRLNSESAVVKTVEMLEQDPLYNAGYGSKLQLDGKPRPEAGIMDDELKIGAVIGLEGIENPISIANVVKNRMNNNVIGPPYSTYIALQEGFNRKDLTTKSRIEEWLDVKEEITGLSYDKKNKKLRKLDKDSGTVGCVGVDSEGNLCAGTSTGGRTYQVRGRIGDSPIPGSGYYCNSKVAVSTTGVGESIMSSQLSVRVANNYENYGDIEKSVKEAADYLESRTEGYCGIIAVDHKGNSEVFYNSENMCFKEIKNYR